MTGSWRLLAGPSEEYIVSQESPINKKLDDTVLAFETVFKIYFDALMVRLLPIAAKIVAAISIWVVSLILVALIIDSFLNQRFEHGMWLAGIAAMGILSSVLILKFTPGKRSHLKKYESVSRYDPQNSVDSLN